MPSLRGKVTRLLSRTPAAWVVLAAGVALSVVAWTITQSQIERGAQAKFRTVNNDVKNAIQVRLRGWYDLMFGLQGLFRTTPQLSREGFHLYVSNLALAQRYPGIRSITYSERVPVALKDEFENRVRRDTSIDPRGYPDFAINPPGERPEYVAIVYIEPMADNEAGLGLDLTADERRDAVERARDTGAAAASGRLILLSDVTQREPAFSLRLPVYRNDRPSATTEQRRAAFAGIISTTVLVRDLVSDILGRVAPYQIHLRIHDAGHISGARSSGELNGKKNLLFESPLPYARTESARAVFSETVPLDVGGRRWYLGFSAPRDNFFTAVDYVLPWAVLAGGMVISFLLYGLIRSLATSGQRAVSLAERITADLRASEAKLLEAQRMTQELIEALPNPIFFKGTDGRYLGVNKAWETFFGIPRTAFIGKTVYDLYPNNREVAENLHAMDQVLWENPGTQVYETTITTPHGEHHDTIYYKATYTRSDGSVAGLIGTIIDITDRKQAEKRQAMEHSVTRVLAEATTLAEAVPKIIQTICETMGWHCGARWVWDRQLNLLRCCECWGIDTPEIQEFVSASSKRTVRPVPVDQGLVRRTFASGRPVWIADISQDQGLNRKMMVSKAGLHGAFGFPLLVGHDVLGVMEFFHRDVREPDDLLIRIAQSIGSQIGQYMVRKQAEEAVQFVATHDSLTGLPNRVMFNERLGHAIAQARRRGHRLAILFIDLDRFKVINDTLGHEAGDALLREVAGRLTENLRASDTVARLGGDEFVVLIEEVSDPVYIATVAQKLITVLGESFVISGQEYHVTASLGASTYPDDSEDLQTLLKNADIAMYRSKEQGRNTFQFYSAQMNTHSIERLSLESGLRRALERNELVLHYQPQTSIQRAHVTGVEALVRWQHPERGLIPPSMFIQIAEETGLIVPVCEWVLHSACALQGTWHQLGMSPVRIAVNLSPRQFIQGDLLKDVMRSLKQSSCEMSWLELEITESMVMHNPQRAVSLIRQLKDMGLRIAIDDFGTGYSSLAYLQRFPIDSLKIDRSFIQDVPRNTGNTAITQAVIAMAHSLQLNVIAEGVETGEQLAFLRDHDCDEIQGYYFSRPLPEADVTAFLQLTQRAAPLHGEPLAQWRGAAATDSWRASSR